MFCSFRQSLTLSQCLVYLGQKSIRQYSALRLASTYAKLWLPAAPVTELISHSFLYSTTSVSRDPDITFSNILSAENRQRCRKLLATQKPVEPKNLPWLRGRNVKDMKPAAVMIPLCITEGKPSVLFTVRSNHLPTHKGEVCFPGGTVDKADDGVVDAALRELEEEIGLKSENVEVLGQMLPIPGRNYEFLVTPVLGYCGNVDMTKLQISEREVSDVFVGSIASLCEEHNVHYTTYKIKPMLSMPIYTGQKHRIWGLTALILHQTLLIIANGLYSVSFQLFPKR